MTDQTKMTHAEAGRKGGNTTATRHGRAHMRKIGKRGAAAFHRRYKLTPMATNNFAIVDRETGQVVSTMYGYHPTRVLTED